MAEACTHLHQTQQLVLLLLRPESASAWLKRSAASCTRCAARWGCLWQLHAGLHPCSAAPECWRMAPACAAAVCTGRHQPTHACAGRAPGERGTGAAGAGQNVYLSSALKHLVFCLLPTGGAPGGGGAGAAGAGQPGQAAAGPGADAEGALRAGTYSACAVCLLEPAVAVPCCEVVE